MPTEGQVLAFFAAQDSINAFLEAWSDYAESSSTHVVPATIVRAYLAVTEQNLTLLRPPV